MDAHADAQLASLSGMFGEGALSSDRGFAVPLGGTEGDEEGVSLGVDLDAAVGGERVAQDGALVFEGVSVVVTEGAEEARRALDGGEDERDGAFGQLSHAHPGPGWMFNRKRQAASSWLSRPKASCRVLD